MPLHRDGLVLVLLALPCVARAETEWIDEFPSVTAVAHAAFEELRVTSQTGNLDMTSDADSIAVNLAATFVVLRQILALKRDAGPRLSRSGEDTLHELDAAYQQAELTIGEGAPNRLGYIKSAPPSGMGCGTDMQCYRRWFLLQLNASSSNAEYRERLLRRLFPCGGLAKELDDLRQTHATSIAYTPSPAATLALEPSVAGLAPAGCGRYGGDSNADGLCDDWQRVPASSATAGEAAAAGECGPLELTRVRAAPLGGLKVSIATGTVEPGARIAFRVVRAVEPADGGQEAWSGYAAVEQEAAADASLFAILAPAGGFPPDPARPVLRVDATSVPSRGPVYCEQPSTLWLPRQRARSPTGLHGPYPSLDAAIRDDAASEIAWASTNGAEFGFLVVRRWPPVQGEFYTTPPRRSSQSGLLVLQPKFLGADYYASFQEGFEHSCEVAEDFVVVATAHTHPIPPRFELDPPYNFSMDDFDQAVQLYGPQLRAFGPKMALHTALDAIVMLDRRDRCIRMFSPREGDREFGFLESLGGGWLPNDLYERYTARVNAAPMASAGVCHP